MKELTVKFQLDDDMFAELEELQQGFHEWKNKDGQQKKKLHLQFFRCTRISFYSDYIIP